MLRRTMLGMAAVLGMIVVSSGAAFANPGWGCHHGGYRGGYGYGGGYRGYGYGYGPRVVAPVVVPPAFGAYGYAPGVVPGYGAYGYGSPYGGGLGYTSPGFGFYVR